MITTESHLSGEPENIPLGAKIYVAGHRGLVGSAIFNRLQREGYTNLIVRTHQELDLCDQQATERFFDSERPEYIYLSAAKVGGILANATYPAEFIHENITIASNVIHAAYKYKVRKLLNLGSSCVYPRLAPQPMKEEYLLTGPLEPTNRAYAVAKIAAIEMCDSYRAQHGCDFISAMPTNIYGPGDNFDLQKSHVLPALMKRMVSAKQEKNQVVTVWGSGKALREFLYVDDLAEGCIFLMNSFSQLGPINIGTGQDISIRDLAYLIREIVGYEGLLAFDASKPDGTPRKLLDVNRLSNAGWKAKIDLRQGIEQTYQWYMETLKK